MRSKLLILFAVIIAAISAAASDYQYLKDFGGADISGNGYVCREGGSRFELKFVTDDSASYYVLWPDGSETLSAGVDTLGIGWVQINPASLNPGNYLLEILDAGKSKRLNFSFKVEKRTDFLQMILTVLLGLVFFMIGLKNTSKAISRISGHRLKEVFWNLSGSSFKGMLSGLVLTTMLQSSTVFSVLVTSFVSDGLIDIAGAIAMLAGSAIGTSIVVQIIAFNISFFSILLIIFGFYIYDKSRRIKYYGLLVMGFGFIFFAIQMMASAILPLRETQTFVNMFIFLQNNLLLLFVISTLVTFAFHSSAVTVALVMGLAASGAVTYHGIITMVAAANLGTTFTAAIASMRGDRNAKFVTAVNLAAKITTTAAFLFLMLKFAYILENLQMNSHYIANLHLLFNIMFALLVLMLMPVIKRMGVFIKMGVLTITGRKIYDESISETPALAVARATRDMTKMAEITTNMLEKSFEVIKLNDRLLMNDILKMDEDVDDIEKRITLFVTSVNEGENSPEITKKIKDILLIVDEIEHVGDVISKNIMAGARKKIDNNYYFSEEGFDDLKEMHARVTATFKTTVGLLSFYDPDQASTVMNRREETLELLNRLQTKHLQRLRENIKESLETSTLHLDILNDYERINFHAYKIAKIISG